MCSVANANNLSRNLPHDRRSRLVYNSTHTVKSTPNIHRNPNEFISGNQQHPLHNTLDDLCWWCFLVLHNTHIVHGCAVPGGHSNEVITTHMFASADAAPRRYHNDRMSAASTHTHLSWLPAQMWKELCVFTSKMRSDDKSSCRWMEHTRRCFCTDANCRFGLRSADRW